MIRRPRFWILAAAAAVLAACGGPSVAPDRQAPSVLSAVDPADLENKFRDQRRLGATSFPILRAARAFCGDNTRPFYGLSAAETFTEISFNGLEVVAPRGDGESLKVLYTVPYSPARYADLRNGDTILSVNGLRPEKSGSRILFDAMAQRTDDPIWLLTQRRGAKRMVRLDAVEICDIPVELAGTPGALSWAAGGKVKVGKGMMRLAGNENELALIIAHELSHVILNHTSSFIGTGAANLESDADYMGLYLMARAGYRPQTGLALFRRLASYPAINNSLYYPTLDRRCAALARTIEEIAAKRDAGLDLIPDRSVFQGRAGNAVREEAFAERLSRIKLSVRAPAARKIRNRAAGDGAARDCR